MAVQLARAIPDCIPALAAELRKDTDLPHKSISDQVKRLIIVPLDSVAPRDRRVVFVIDALDECSNQDHFTELLSVLEDFQSAVLVKFLVASRPDPRIRRQSAILGSAISTHISLDTDDPDQIMADIQFYIRKMFKNSVSTSVWWTTGDVKDLAKLAGGLFLFAAVTTTFILKPTHSPRRLDRLRSVKKLQAETALELLDVM